MYFDPISSCSIPAASNANNLTEKKPGNNDAEFEKDKPDVGCQQGLLEVKEGCEEEPCGDGVIDVPPMHAPNGRDNATGALEVTSDLDLSSNSPSSHIESVVESICSGTNLSGSSNSSFFLIEDGGELDDWETLADALAAADDNKDQQDPKSESFAEKENVTQLDYLPEVVKQPAVTVDVLKQQSDNCDREFKSGVEKGKVARSDQPTATKDVRNPRPGYGQEWRNGDAFHGKPRPLNGQAWRRHAFRWKPKPAKCEPKSLVEGENGTQLDHLPKVVNQPIATMDVLNNGGTTLGCKNFVSPPSSCPICCEDLDRTDSSFFPCSCGFQLCLFCHKRILEEDGRCPGCRKHYDNCPV
ncbi:uncharacterized protein LOC141661844 [Apium graveolens]|uniref:uncharacterized protein LOC141661844 n=1 Tax=Apium graveolens TaxID=4045 RepID=UPI003D793EF3